MMKSLYQARRLTLLVTSFLVIPSLCQEVLEDGATAPRANSCCTILFTKDVSCACDELVLRRGDIPAGAVAVLLSDIAKLTISEDAFYHLPTLRHLQLRDIGHITVESGGLRLPENNSLVEFTAAYIGSMQIAEGALTGQWRDRSAIKLQDINKLEIASRGLSCKTSNRGLVADFSNINLLELGTEALDTRMKVIWLKNVHMHECPSGTFDSKIDYVNMHNVTIAQVQTRCFNDVGELSVLSHRGVNITSGTLDSMHPQAFYGNISSISLGDQTRIGNVTEQGFQARVERFYMHETEIDTLSTKGLSVSFKETFEMKQVHIKHLHKGAFIGVQGIPNGGRPPTVSLTSLEVNYAEAGSMAMSHSVDVDVTNYVQIQEAAVARCPPDRWANVLLGDHGRRKISDAELKLFEVLHQDAKSWCDDNDGRQEHTDEEPSFTSEGAEKSGDEHEIENGDPRGMTAGDEIAKDVSYESDGDDSDEEPVPDKSTHENIAASSPGRDPHPNIRGKHADARPIRSDETNDESEYLDVETPEENPNVDTAKPGKTSSKDPYDVSYDYDVVWSERNDPRLNNSRPVHKGRKVQAQQDRDPWMIAFFSLTAIAMFLLICLAALAVIRCWLNYRYMKLCNQTQASPSQQRLVDDGTCSHPEAAKSVSKCDPVSGSTATYKCRIIERWE